MYISIISLHAVITDRLLMKSPIDMRTKIHNKVVRIVYKILFFLSMAVIQSM